MRSMDAVTESRFKNAIIDGVVEGMDVAASIVDTLVATPMPQIAGVSADAHDLIELIRKQTLLTAAAAIREQAERILQLNK